MLLFAAVSLFLIFWVSLQLADLYLQKSNSVRYIRFLEHYGLSFAPFQLRLYLTNFDRNPQYENILKRLIVAHGPRRPKFLTYWFTFGAFISLICFLLTPIYLLRLLISELTVLLPGNAHPITKVLTQEAATITPPSLTYNPHSMLYIPLQEHISAGITPIFPGINLPFSHMPIFITVLIVASIVHEAGHAFAAASANVRVTGLGIFLFAIYPGAFTEIEPDELDRCSYAQKLRIYCAGIWHNIVLAVFGFLFLISIPLLCLPLYSNNAGVVVTDVNPTSGISGATGLQPGYQIQRINQCEVRNTKDWAQCFAKISGKNSLGFLAQFRAVHQMTASPIHVLAQTDGEIQCCKEFNVTSSTHICFRYLAPAKKENPKKATTLKPIFPNFPNLDVPLAEHPRWKRANFKMRQMTKTPDDFQVTLQTHKEASISNENPTAQQGFYHACLPAMQITEHAICEITTLMGYDFTTLPPGYVCVFPALLNGTALLRFEVKDYHKPVLFIGYLDEPLHMVEISELSPRFTFIPWWIPRICEHFARYFITLSLAMGILNAVPCYGLDGQFISSTVIDYFCQNYSSSVRRRIERILMVGGTFIFCSNILIGFLKLLLF